MSAAARNRVKICIDHDIAQSGGELAKIFYALLFARHPEFKKRPFDGNEAVLKRKFLAMLSTLHDVKYMEKISPAIAQMGMRHFQLYGVSANQYKPFKLTLLNALDEYLGTRFNSELRHAWESVLDEVMAVMLSDTKPDNPSTHKVLATNPSDDSQDDPFLLEDLGGEEVVTRVHRRLYDYLFDEPWLWQFFRGKSKDALIDKQSRFMVGIMGGINRYQGESPALTHMHLFITTEMLEVRGKILTRAILEEGLSPNIADRWLRLDRSFWPSIAKQSVEECTMKCPGQQPITAEKPAGYKSSK